MTMSNERIRLGGWEFGDRLSAEKDPVKSQNYDPNGLANRVKAKVEQVLNITTVYVAQEGSKVVFSGTISDPTLLEKIRQIAIDEGATEVDTTQVEVK